MQWVRVLKQCSMQQVGVGMPFEGRSCGDTVSTGKGTFAKDEGFRCDSQSESKADFGPLMSIQHL